MCLDKEDIEKDKIKQKIPGYRVFFDFEGRISKGYKALHEGSESLRPYTLLIDPNMRVLKAWSFDSPRTHVNEVVEFIKNLPPMKATEVPAQMQAPVLVLPRILEPELCHELIAYYDKKGGYDSGFMRQQGEKTVGIVDHGFKRRDDCMIEEEELRKVIRDHITRRLTPQIRKAFQFNATHMERYLVARYDSVSGGFFRAHRDNTTKATAHRKFAVTLNLNAEDYEGGDLMFPEFGWQRYRAPTGGCVVFSCSVLHEAMPVTKDARYAFLPFLYDEAGAKLREENIKFLATESTKEKEEYVK